MYGLKHCLGLSVLSFWVAGVVCVQGAQAAERKCGVHVRSAMEKQQSEQRLAEESVLVYKTFPPVNHPVTIPVRFHIIQSATGAGNIANGVLNKQITVLNNAYKGSGFRFAFAGVERTRNTEWFDGCLDKASLQTAYKNALAVDPAHNLNIYTCASHAGILGFASFPDDYAEGSRMHGVVLSHDTFPGNPGAYGQGDTATHEIGHYFGLYHTFDDSGRGTCSRDNDLVDDTAVEGHPASGCPARRDTCPAVLGKDPVVNYMDYSSDECMTSFSLGQIKRMQQQVITFCPSLIP